MYRLQKQVPEILSIIPARSGSSEVKYKNIKLLGDKPLLYYTIMASTKSLVSRTIVSTDSPRIVEIAKKYGAEVPFLRPKFFSTSTSSSISVILHCLDFLKRKENYSPDYVVFLQPTSPFRTFLDVNNGIMKILKTKTMSLVGIVQVSEHPYWMFKKSKNDKLSEFVTKKNKPLRRQDLPSLYCINDALFISKSEYYHNASLNDPVFDKNNLSGFEMDRLHSFDINTKFDFKIAEYLSKSIL